MLGLLPFRFKSALSGTDSDWQIWVNKHSSGSWKTQPNLWTRALDPQPNLQKIVRLLDAGLDGNLLQKNGKSYLAGQSIQTVIDNIESFRPLIHATDELPWTNWMDNFIELKWPGEDTKNILILADILSTHPKKSLIFSKMVKRLNKDITNISRHRKKGVGVLRRKVGWRNTTKTKNFFYTEKDVNQGCLFQLEVFERLIRQNADNTPLLMEWAKDIELDEFRKRMNDEPNLLLPDHERKLKALFEKLDLMATLPSGKPTLTPTKMRL